MSKTQRNATAARTTPERTPRVSFGLPVRNGEASIRRCLDSLLAQDFTDLEVVVSDNASTDRTPEILDEYAARDPRVRVFRNEENIGQIENVNLVFRLSRGEYFRWIGVDDWLEPQYASRCVEVLDSDSGAIGVTTFFRLHRGDGTSTYEEYPGERVESELPQHRFARMLWFFHAGDQRYDPIYSLLRRDVLERTSLIRMMVWADCMLAAELSLIGRFRHVPLCLAHRVKAYKEHYSDRERLLRRYHPVHFRTLEASPWRIFRVLLSIVEDAPLDWRQRMRCRWETFLFLFKETYRQNRRAWRRIRRETFGVTREKLGRLLPRRRDR